jgi:hypothetical protein
VTTETANLMLALQAGGAEIALCASNPLSTQDDVAAALCEYGIPTYAIKGEDNATYYSHIESVIATKPHMSMDDGCDLVTTIYTKHNHLLRGYDRRLRGDDDRRHSPARRCSGRRAALSGDRGEQRAHQAHVRQSLRHRPIDARRHHSCDQRAAGRAQRSLSSATAGAGAESRRARPAWARTSS